MKQVSFLQSLHNSSKRDYFARMTPEKPECMRVAKQYGKDYWDGDRKYGYGGYHYDGRWKPVADRIVKHYKLAATDLVLDIGCGKGFLLSDIKNSVRRIGVRGCDISPYALDRVPDNLALCKKVANCANLPYHSHYFDFTYSINVFHNLGYKDLKQAIKEMVRVTMRDGKSYICVESYRNDQELTNLQAWQLTCLSYYSPDDWMGILTDNGYNGDVEFITFS